jgi:hypothetical protein
LQALLEHMDALEAETTEVLFEDTSVYDPCSACSVCHRRVGELGVGCNVCMKIADADKEAPRCQGGVDCGAIGERPCTRVGCGNLTCEFHRGRCGECVDMLEADEWEVASISTTDSKEINVSPVSMMDDWGSPISPTTTAPDASTVHGRLRTRPRSSGCWAGRAPTW